MTPTSSQEYFFKGFQNNNGWFLWTNFMGHLKFKINFSFKGAVSMELHAYLKKDPSRTIRTIIFFYFITNLHSPLTEFFSEVNADFFLRTIKTLIFNFLKNNCFHGTWDLWKSIFLKFFSWTIWPINVNF